MTNLYRTVIVFDGWQGGSGVSTFHFSEGTIVGNPQGTVDQAYSELHGLAGVMAQFMRPGTTMEVRPYFDVIDEVNGQIVDVISTDADAVVTATGTGGRVSTATMLCVRYDTDVWKNGAHLRGRTFWGPVASSQIHESGMFEPSALEAAKNAYAAMTSGVGPRLAAYHRPGKLDLAGGYYGDVRTATPLQKPAILRSRRD